MIYTNIFKQELRAHQRSIIVWSLALILLIIVFMSFFSTFTEQAAIMSDLMDNFPPALRTAFGLNNSDLSSILGYFAFIFIFVQLCVAVQSSNYGVGLVSIEENELTADFLLTKPVSHLKLLSSKILAAISSLMITNIVVWLVSLLAITNHPSKQVYDAGSLTLIFASLIFLEIFFLCIGLLISLLVKRVRSIIPYSLGLVFGAYVLNAFGDVFGGIKLELLTPFKHLDPGYIIQNGQLNTPLVLLNIAVSLVCLAISYVLYLRRDIAAAS